MKLILFIEKVIIRRIKSLFGTSKDVLQTAKKERRVFADKEEQERRLGICRSCELFLPNGMCDVCGCFMTAKTKFHAAKCPLEERGERRKW
jgi:hypothetical protein